MENESSTIGRCPQCSGAVDVRTRHVLIDGPSVRAFCSEVCVALANAPAPIAHAAPQQNWWFSKLLRVGIGLPFLAFTSGPPPPPPPVPIAVAAVEPAAPPEPPQFGPPWPPSEQDWTAQIAEDAWIHPLDGPNRRMPITDSRVFGAERPGERPGECNNGHCGVDLSGPWGEPVHAAHDGIVDRVQRGPNEEHGGLYVRIAHRDGSIFSQYFHLAAIPKRLEKGARVRAGEVIGLLGDTGVQRSAPHLHFTISVKPSPLVEEHYMDPEPLIALWPLRILVGEEVGVVTTQAAPGVPHGAVEKHRKKRAVRTAKRVSEAPPIAVEEPIAAAE